MRASLDTNVIIHMYKADRQGILFDFFNEGVFIYEQIRVVELENHGAEILDKVDKDISDGKIRLYTDDDLRAKGMYRVFMMKVEENRLLYNPGDLGEVYAISLAQTLGAYSIVTDDIKQGGPYMSLLQFEGEEIMPFSFADVLILRYLLGKADAHQTVRDFDEINNSSELDWSFRSHLTRFIKRFIRDPYRNEDVEWLKTLADSNKICVRDKLMVLKGII